MCLRITIIFITLSFFSYLYCYDFSVQYNSRNKTSAISYPNGYSITYNYDSHGNLINQTVTVPNATPLSPTQFTLENNGITRTLSWQPVTTSTGGNPIIVSSYSVEASDNPYSGFVTIGTTTQTQFTDVANLSKRFYRIRASTGIVVNNPNFVLINGGTFSMGRTTGSGDADELPIHQVTLSPYYISKYEVTQSEWLDIMGTNPSYYPGDLQRPVEMTNWYMALVYCNKMSIHDGLTPVYTVSGSTNPDSWGSIPTTSSATWNAAICNWSANGYRLPTEAEWEYAARGATTTPDYIYSGSNDLGSVGWYESNSGSVTHPVGTKSANGAGLFDMSGNDWEWCWDWYGSYGSSAIENPYGPSSGTYKVLRSGCWANPSSQCRISERLGVYYPYSTNPSFGLRLVRSY